MLSHQATSNITTVTQREVGRRLKQIMYCAAYQRRWLLKYVLVQPPD
uniref:Uncharacterized protein n=1 Tax=Rhizobium rhizogenes TaxID=359 RepID=A0A7S5DQM0_RHIRH|nr:hypothetical protein pC6.5c_511 [Rhizobium rhizogenes]QCO89370.1 hypothetical protein pC5.7d_654 [Rhizobium rhizogenes]